MKSIRNRIHGFKWIYVFLFSVTLSHAGNNWKYVNHKISYEKIGPTKYPPQKILDPRNTHEKKVCTHEIPTRKMFVPTKFPRKKVSDSRNSKKKKFGTHEISTTKKFWPTKYPQRHDDTMKLNPRDPRWYATHEI